MEYIKLKDALHIIDLVITDDAIKHTGKAIRKRLKELPTVEVKCGQWEKKPSRLGSHYELYACSCCGFTYTFNPNYNYCPRCGAEMRGADNG